MSNSLQPHGLYSPRNSPGQNIGVGNLSLLQGIFPTQGSNPGLPHCRLILYQLSHRGSPGWCYTWIPSHSTSLVLIMCLKYVNILLSHFSCLWLSVTPWTIAFQGPLSMGFSRQEYWSGLPWLPPGDLPNPRIKPSSPISPALASRFFTTSAT